MKALQLIIKLLTPPKKCSVYIISNKNLCCRHIVNTNDAGAPERTACVLSETSTRRIWREYWNVCVIWRNCVWDVGEKKGTAGSEVEKGGSSLHFLSLLSSLLLPPSLPSFRIYNALFFSGIYDEDLKTPATRSDTSVLRWDRVRGVPMTTVMYCTNTHWTRMTMSLQTAPGSSVCSEPQIIRIVTRLASVILIGKSNVF